MRTILVLLGLLAITACGPTPAQRDQISATQAVVDQKVRAGEMSPEQGRLIMATLRADMDAERRRNYAIMTSGDGPAVYQPVGGGTYIKY